MISTNNSAPSPGQPLQPSLSEGQGGARNLPVGTGDQQMTTLNSQKDTLMDESMSTAIPIGGGAGDSQIETLEPYEPNRWQTVNRRKTNQKRRNERNIKQLVEMEKLFEEKPYFKSIYTIKFPGVNISEDLNLIKTDNELKAACGKLKRITKSGKSTLLIETISEEQASKLIKLKKIADEVVIIEPHRNLNQVKGVIKSKALSKNTLEELKERLSEQGVADIQRIKIRKNGEEITTDTYIVHFNKLTLPKVIKITDWHYEQVQQYNHQPQQCFNCQRFGHVAKYCRRNERTCVRCGLEGHTKQSCENQVKCFHCEQPHYANDKTCNKYKIEKEIVETQYKEKVSKIEATQIVLARLPDANKLYSEVVRLTEEKTESQDRNDSEVSSGRTPSQTIKSTHTNVGRAHRNNDVRNSEKDETRKQEKSNRVVKEKADEKSIPTGSVAGKDSSKRGRTDDTWVSREGSSKAGKVEENTKNGNNFTFKRIEHSKHLSEQTSKEPEANRDRSQETGRSGEECSKDLKRSKSEFNDPKKTKHHKSTREETKKQESKIPTVGLRNTSTIQVLIGK